MPKGKGWITFKLDPRVEDAVEQYLSAHGYKTHFLNACITGAVAFINERIADGTINDYLDENGRLQHEYCRRIGRRVAGNDGQREVAKASCRTA